MPISNFIEHFFPQTEGQTDRQTDRRIEASSRSLKTNYNWILFPEDVEYEYSKESHTLHMGTPGMEVLIREYKEYKSGYVVDPVEYVKGSGSNDYNCQIQM